MGCDPNRGRLDVELLRPGEVARERERVGLAGWELTGGWGSSLVLWVQDQRMRQKVKDEERERGEDEPWRARVGPGVDLWLR